MSKKRSSVADNILYEKWARYTREYPGAAYMEKRGATTSDWFEAKNLGAFARRRRYAPARPSANTMDGI